MIADAVKAMPGAHLFGDIGCYTLGVNPPYESLHTCVEMGASIGMGLGAAKTGAHPIICTIGDSTFTHSGMPSLLAAAHEDANMTVVIMDNSGVAMTGGQDGFVTGEQFIRLLRGLGVDAHHIVQIDPVPKTRALNLELFRKEVEHLGLSVIIASRPCIHMKRRAASSSHAMAERKPAELNPAAPLHRAGR
jgi:indolepyruvate ferredoxin oxidoreductase alpha subunit